MEIKLSLVPWEFDLNKRRAIEAIADPSSYISPSKARIVVLDKMFKVTTISAEFDSEIVVYDPLFLCARSNEKSIKFIGIYTTYFALDQVSLPDIAIRQCSWEHSYGNLSDVFHKLSCQTVFIRSQDDLGINRIVSTLQDSPLEEITTLSHIERESGYDTFEFYFSSKSLTLRSSYFSDSCSNIFIENIYNQLMTCWLDKKVKTASVAADSFRVSFK